MCGIHGIASLNDAPLPDVQVMAAMANVTRHRGPDDEGLFTGDGVAMGMRRLSIIDVSGGQQPISNEDQSVWTVCNGEIYNFRELRKELTAKGHRFRTASDCEVLVHLYEEYGDNFVGRLNGMFGFAIWDVARRRLLIGRDRLGIKPVYYLQDRQRLIFASEAKAILQVPGVSAELAPEALGEYLTLGYVPCPHSIFRGIRKLPPASLMIVEDGQVRISEYWSLAEIDENKGMNSDDWSQALRSAIEKSVVAQMVSDVPLGAFLSGGIDSSGVVAMMARNSDLPVKTYSIGFSGSSGGSYYNELPYARQVAKLFATDHSDIIVEPDVISLLPKLIWHMDEPIADAAFITTYLVSEFARENVTVILSGVGGDELFGGYPRYLGEYYRKYYTQIPAWFRSNVFRPMASWLPSDRHSPLLNLSRYAKSFIESSDLNFEERYLSYVGVFSPDEADEVLTGTSTGSGQGIYRAFDKSRGDSVNRLMAVDIATQLPDDLLMLTDKMSMATSLECRVPLLDHELVELAASMPSDQKIHGRNLKYAMKRALTGVLPKEILYRKKRGFGAPMGAWFENELSSVLRSALSKRTVENRGLFSWSKVEQTMREHESNRADNTDHLQSILNLEIWCRLYLDGQSYSDIADSLKSKCKQ